MDNATIPTPALHQGWVLLVLTSPDTMSETMIPVLELCVHCVVARHLLPGRHLPSGSSEAEAGTGQTKQVSVDTGMLLETGYLSIPPPLPSPPPPLSC